MRRRFIALLAFGVLGAAIALPTSANAACFGWKAEVFWCDDDWFRLSEARPDKGPEATATPRATVTKTPSDAPTSTPVATVTKTPAGATSTPRAVVTKTPGTATATATSTPRPATTVTPTLTPAPTPLPTPLPTATPSAPTPVKSGKVLQSFGLTRNGRTLFVPVYSSFPLSETNEAVTHAVVVIHGTNRNAVDYFDYADAAVPSSVLVVAPRFQTADDSPESNELYWTSGEWKQGGQSTGSRPWEMSSFTVADELLRSMRATFPNLDTIVVAGHSGGGQFVQRYAATNRDARNHFVVANPSSYMFLNSKRPESTSGCSWYNEYKYGLDDLNDVPYVEAIGAATPRSRYEVARVTYLLNANDTNEDDSDLDTTCGAEAQGPHRRARGENFYESLESVYGRNVYSRHTLRVVSGVGHSAREMFGSSAGRAALAE